MGDDRWLVAEDARVAGHLEGALGLLKSADLDHLDRATRSVRRRHVAELERYARRGRYPRHGAATGPMQPALIDDRGTRCALAHLIETSGGGSLLARLRRLDNHARVRDLAGDVGLVGWLAAAGLSVIEAARIQPSYTPYPTAYECACSSLLGGAAIARLKTQPTPLAITSASPLEGRRPSREMQEPLSSCRGVVDEVLLVGEAGFAAGTELGALCPPTARAGTKVLFVRGQPAQPVARVIVADAVIFGGCDGHGAMEGSPSPPTAITVARIRDAMKADPASCSLVIAGKPAMPPQPAPLRPPPKPEQPPAVTTPQLSASPTRDTPHERASPTEKPIELEPEFPQPVHVLVTGGTLLVAGTVAYLVLRRRG